MENMLSAGRGEAELSFVSPRGVKESWSPHEALDMGREVTMSHQQQRQTKFCFVQIL